MLYKFSLVVESVDTCVILEGPSGCGKTMLVQTLAGVVQSTPELMVVHLGEQIDGKVCKNLIVDSLVVISIVSVSSGEWKDGGVRVDGKMSYLIVFCGCV